MCAGLNDVEILRKATREDIVELFNTYICPTSNSRRKVSVQCKSQVADSVKFTVEAAVAFCADVKEAGIAIDEEQFRLLAAKEPPLESVVSHWEALLEKSAPVDDDRRTKLLSRLLLTRP